MASQSFRTKIILLICIFNFGLSQFINANPGALHQRKFTVFDNASTNNAQPLPILQQIQTHQTHHETLGCCAIISQTALEYKRDLDHCLLPIKQCQIPRSVDHCIDQVDRCIFAPKRDMSHVHPHVRCCHCCTPKIIWWGYAFCKLSYDTDYFANSIPLPQIKSLIQSFCTK